MTTAFTVVDPTSMPITRPSVMLIGSREAGPRKLGPETDTGVSLPAPGGQNQAFRPFSCGDMSVSNENPRKCGQSAAPVGTGGWPRAIEISQGGEEVREVLGFALPPPIAEPPPTGKLAFSRENISCFGPPKQE